MAIEVEQAAGERRETARLEAFSDGVFAIAVTLLVLDIKVPQVEGLAAGDLGRALLDQWPVYFAYVFSFLTILVMWVSHHAIFNYIARINQPFLIINGLLLMGITVVPFPTALLSEYLKYPERGDDQKIAAAVYSGTFTAIAILFNVLWRYAAHNNRLMGAQMDPVFAQALSRRYILGPLIYFASFLLAFVSVPASFAIYVLLAVFFAIPMPTAAGRQEPGAPRRDLS
jgi:uncharacterized membrane protein